MGRSTEEETRLSEQRKYRSWTAQQKLEIVLAGLRGDRSVREVCREHAISETLYYGWRDQLLEAGRERLAGKQERQGERVQQLLSEGAQLVEVLPQAEYEDEHLPGAISIPLKELNRETARQLRRDQPVVVYCHDYQ
jgi:transposase-like protein